MATAAATIPIPEIATGLETELITAFNEEEDSGAGPVESPEKPVISRRKLLLVLDLNGLLLDCSLLRLGGAPAGSRVNRKWIYPRPGVLEFLRFCFSRFEVGVWSCAMSANVHKYLAAVFPAELHRQLLFVWGQERCSQTGEKVPVSGAANRRKPMLLKELKRLWEAFPHYGRGNTLMLDDSPYKSLRNPAGSAVFPTAYSRKEHARDEEYLMAVLLPWLEKLWESEQPVPGFVRERPLGQPAISSAHPLWEQVYSKLVVVEEDDDSYIMFSKMSLSAS